MNICGCTDVGHKKEQNKMAKLKEKIKKMFFGNPSDADESRVKWSLYWRVWREIGIPQIKWLIFGVVATVLAAGAEAYTITLVQQVVDKAFIEKSMAAIYFLAVQIIIAYALKGVFTYSKDLIMSKGGLIAYARLQKRIYNHMVHMNLSRFYGDGFGKNLNYFTVGRCIIFGDQRSC